ncbi:SAM-dependent methyltransferase [Pelomyxa schiedti]|nr:SAM-dependent methyltransferase [Pelomyxa schiedti]
MDFGACPISKTSLMVAECRAQETEKGDGTRRFNDPVARLLAGDRGRELLSRVPSIPGWSLFESIVLRTLFFDKAVLDAVRGLGNGSSGASTVQVVLLASGMDTKAYRLDWPTGVHIFEVDFEDVLQYKTQVIAKAGITSRASAHACISANLLSDDWVSKLISTSFCPTVPSVIVIEGLSMYLTESDVTSVIQKVSALAVKNSVLVVDLYQSAEPTTPEGMEQVAKIRAYFEQMGATIGGLKGSPSQFLESHGWNVDYTNPSNTKVFYKCTKL